VPVDDERTDLDLPEARVDGLAEALARVGPALDRALSSDGARAAARSSWRAGLAVELPATGLTADAVLDELVDVVAGAALPLGAPGFAAWVATAPPVVPAVAQLVASVAAPQRWWVHPGNAIEKVALRWIAELVGFGLPDAPGAFVSGGAVANLIALAAARQRAGARRGIDVAADGVIALGLAPKVYASEDAHHVIGRACAVLGLGRTSLVRIPSGRGLGMDPGALERAVRADVDAGFLPVAIVATAGDASTGAIDPIGDCAAVARNHGVWLHVDGAYGAFAALDPRVDLPLDLADSVAVDPHKWLAVPSGTGAVLVRDRAALEGALAVDAAPYLRIVRRTSGDPTSPFDELGEGSPTHTIEHSAPSRGVVVWAALRELGRAGLAARVARHLDCARRVASRVRAAPNLELLAEPVLSICCFRARPPNEKRSGEIDRFNEHLARAVRARGRIVLSTTRVAGKLALRPCFLGPRTTLAEADLLVDEVLAAAMEL
jgi:aromatic-L-amino-acid decarboxylase